MINRNKKNLLKHCPLCFLTQARVTTSAPKKTKNKKQTQHNTTENRNRKSSPSNVVDFFRRRCARGFLFIFCLSDPLPPRLRPPFYVTLIFVLAFFFIIPKVGLGRPFTSLVILLARPRSTLTGLLFNTPSLFPTCSPSDCSASKEARHWTRRDVRPRLLISSFDCYSCDYSFR